jgi:aldehyde dehydrogenase (NAD+)
MRPSCEEIFGRCSGAGRRFHDRRSTSSTAKPLALYIFSARRTPSTSAETSPAVRQQYDHAIGLNLPRWGSTSGMGSYHGKSGFDAFSHHKSVLT